MSPISKDGVLPKPANYAYPFPNLLTFHDAPTVIEQKLFVMYLEHRMRTFQGTFHASPDYALWYGWSVLGAWIVGLLLLFVGGKILSTLTLRLIESDPASSISRTETLVRSCYRHFINVAGSF